ncbi:hypothetical protein H5410_032697 [Solanum commersonii]|uniref:O-fucosyltransferase family protein n=1 Tax=Solanum commersonii TaxID=4109 RepID=A0A9J5YNN4_SOLCO|nr:hypothetical protein H5410_032697 [Solanum commersonii]
MGVAKVWRYSCGVLANTQKQHFFFSCWLWRRPISCTKVCGFMLFALGLISLFTGYVASNLELYSQRLAKGAWFYKQDGDAPIDIWKSRYGSLVKLVIKMSKQTPPCPNLESRTRERWREGGGGFVSSLLLLLGLEENLCVTLTGSMPHLMADTEKAAAVNVRSSNGYLLIATSGGLNQQRTGITDAVVVARILNATLVVPELDHHSFWKDDSDFFDIFDVKWFISYLAKDVTVVKRVPEKVMRLMGKPPYTMRVPRKSEPEYYLDQVLPVLLKRRVLQLTKFDFRLANDLDEELQKLRCRVNYHALRFTKPIRNFGQKLVVRMRKMSRRFVAVHLRFEPDMLAFSGCYYGGGDKERYELAEIRKRWATLPELIPDEERTRGRCPLTPHEVGLMLRALGFKNDTYLYVASGEVYGGDKTLQPLKELFPNFYTKEIVSGDELKPFLPYSSRLAAIDYVVCDESDVFVTNNNGNMAKILAGSRRYMGHKRTIRPNAKRLSALFQARNKMDWDTFSRKVKSCQSGFMGEPEEVRLGRGEFHEYPSSCICKTPFNHSNFIEKYNNHTPSANPSLLDSRYRYIRNSSDLDDKILQKLH